jgi:uncharacterized protein YgiM (DUF1202 family)
MKPFLFPKHTVRILIGCILLALSAPAISSARSKPAVLEVQAPIANFHTQPSPLSPIIDVLTRGDRLTLIQREGEWYVGRLSDNRLGWVHREIFGETGGTPADGESEAGESASSPATTPEPPLPDRLRVASRSAQIRKRPSDHADIAFSLTRDEIVSVLDREEDWYRIRDGSGRTGWAFVGLFGAPDASAAVSAGPRRGSPSPETSARPGRSGPEPIAAPDDSEIPRRVVVEVRSGRVRAEPSANAPVRTGVSRGEVVSVKEMSGDWYAIETDDGESGWAHRGLFGPESRGVLRAVRAELDRPDSETVIFELDGFHPPETFALEENGVLKIVSDFKGILPSADLGRVVPLNGRFLERVRMGVHRSPEPKLRAVVDMSPEYRYGVEQVFFRESNRYSLTIRPMEEDEEETTGDDG